MHSGETVVQAWRGSRNSWATGGRSKGHGENHRCAPARQRTPARRTVGQYHPRAAWRSVLRQDRAHPQGRQGCPQGLGRGRTATGRNARQSRRERTAAHDPGVQPVSQSGQYRRAVPSGAPARRRRAGAVRDRGVRRSHRASQGGRARQRVHRAAGQPPGNRTGAHRASHRGIAPHADPEVRRHRPAAGGTGSHRSLRRRAGEHRVEPAAPDRRGVAHRGDTSQPADPSGRGQVGFRCHREFAVEGGAQRAAPD